MGKPLIVQIYGDKNQCEPFMNVRYYEYQKRRFFRELVDYRIMKKQYDTKTSRYDQELYDFSQYLFKHHCFPKPMAECDK